MNRTLPCAAHRCSFRGASEQREGWRVDRGEQALDHMDAQLSSGDWLAGDALSIADITLFAYTRVADEGGFDLTSRGAVRAWIQRVEGALVAKVLD
jgi:glutathione S-transferase